MAANAVERQSALDTNWLRLLAPNPERLEFATRLALNGIDGHASPRPQRSLPAA